MLLYEATELKKYAMCHGITYIREKKYMYTNVFCE